MKEFLDSEEFYNAMQSYRIASMDDQRNVIAHFEHVKSMILAKLNSAEPVGYEFQDTYGKWCPFIDKRHFDNTRDGRWPIRAIYTTPQLDRTAELDAALREAKGVLQHYHYGGSNYKIPADKAIATIDKVLK